MFWNLITISKYRYLIARQHSSCLICFWRFKIWHVFVTTSKNKKFLNILLLYVSILLRTDYNYVSRHCICKIYIRITCIKFEISLYILSNLQRLFILIKYRDTIAFKFKYEWSKTNKILIIFFLKTCDLIFVWCIVFFKSIYLFLLISILGGLRKTAVFLG